MALLVAMAGASSGKQKMTRAATQKPASQMQQQQARRQHLLLMHNSTADTSVAVHNSTADTLAQRSVKPANHIGHLAVACEGCGQGVGDERQQSAGSACFGEVGCMITLLEKLYWRSAVPPCTGRKCSGF